MSNRIRVKLKMEANGGNGLSHIAHYGCKVNYEVATGHLASK